MSQKILFYVNAGEEIGLGHFFRSVALAKRLRDQGLEIYFYSKKSKFWENQIEQGFEFQHRWVDEINLNKFCYQENIKNIYIDTLEENISFEFNKNEMKIFVFQNRTLLASNADIYITPNLFIDKFLIENFKPELKLYSGLSYVMMNNAVFDINKRNNHKFGNSIGVTVGGSDPHNALTKLYSVIQRTSLSTSWTINFFIPIDYQGSDKILNIKSKDVNFIPYDLNIIAEQDIIISAYGVSVFEFMYLGILTLIFSHSESNAIGAKSLSEHTSAIRYLGSLEELKPNEIENIINETLKNSAIREEIKKEYSKLIDGEGVKRVAEVITANINL